MLTEVIYNKEEGWDRETDGTVQYPGFYFFTIFGR